MNSSILEAPVRPANAWRLRLDTTMAWYAVIVLVVATVFGALDRQILVLLAEPMRRSLDLSDTRLGMLQGLGITLFGGIAALPVAWLADRYGRRLVLACSVLVWGGATAACGFAHDFPVLYAASVGLGIGEAAIVPIIYALIPEVVPARRRALANGLYALASMLGAGLGIALSGYLVHGVDALRGALPTALQAFEPWRLAFLAVAAPAPAVAVLVLQIRRHPRRERPEAAASSGPETLRGFLRANARVVFTVYLGVALASFGLSAAGHWLPVVANRQFHVPTFDIGRGFGAAYVLGTLLGAPLGGLIVSKLRARLGVTTMLRMVSAGLALAGLAAFASAWAAAAAWLYVAFGLEVACVVAVSVVLPTMLQDMMPVALRSRGVAVCMLVTALLSATSPVLVGMLSDAMAPRQDALLVSIAAVQVVGLLFAAAMLRSIEPAHARLVKRLHAVVTTSPGSARPFQGSST